MKKKTTPKRKEILRRRFDEAVNGYVAALCKLWDIEKQSTWFPADDTTGPVCLDTGEAVSLNDMIYVVENDITQKEYMEWADYCTECSSYGLDTVNLQSWHKCAPRIPQTALNKLNELRKRFEDAVEEACKDIKHVN